MNPSGQIYAAVAMRATHKSTLRIWIPLAKNVVGGVCSTQDERGQTPAVRLLAAPEM